MMTDDTMRQFIQEAMPMPERIQHLEVKDGTAEFDWQRHHIRVSPILEATEGTIKADYLEHLSDHLRLKWENSLLNPRRTTLDIYEQNYSRPEQPMREFDAEDLVRLMKSLDNDIRVLERKREVQGRNHLDYHDSMALNRAKLTRAILHGWNPIGRSDMDRSATLIWGELLDAVRRTGDAELLRLTQAFEFNSLTKKRK